MNSQLLLIDIYRQTNPKRNRVASELSDDANLINKKKILVNSQITAMLSILESSSNVAFIILLWYFKGTTYFSLILPLSIYAVILPYSFLMNTSDNKNRIVEVGWKNVFRNLFRPSKNPGINDDDDETKNNVPTQTSTKEETVENSRKEELENNKNGINTISNSATPTNVASSNTAQNLLHHDIRVNNYMESAGHSNFVNLDVKNLIKTSDNYKTRQKLVSRMIKCRHAEEKYIAYFRKLVALHEGDKTENILMDVELDDEYSCNMKQSNQTKDGKIRGKGKRSKQMDFQDDDQNWSNCNIENKTKLNFQGDLKERTLKRVELLNQIYSLSHDKITQYDELIEWLIDLEESFLQNNQ